MAICCQLCISWLPAPSLGGVPILVIDNCVYLWLNPRASWRYDYLYMMRSPSSKHLSSQGGSHALELVKLLACVSRYIIPSKLSYIGQDRRVSGQWVTASDVYVGRWRCETLEKLNEYLIKHSKHTVETSIASCVKHHPKLPIRLLLGLQLIGPDQLNLA